MAGFREYVKDHMHNQKIVFWSYFGVHLAMIVLLVMSWTEVF